MNFESLKPLIREVGGLAWPAMVQGLLSTVVFFTDRMLLGQYEGVALASMQISGPVMWSIFSICGAFGAGTMAVVGRATGANDEERARDTTLVVCTLAFAVGVFLALIGWYVRDSITVILAGSASDTEVIRSLAAEYMGIVFLGAPLILLSIGAITALQATGDTRTPAWITALGGILNLVISWILIYGHWGAPELGVAGAGIGTLSAYFVHGVLCTYALTRAKGPIGPVTRKRRFPPVLRTIIPVVSVSAGAIGERAIFHSGFLIFAGLIGRLGDVAMTTNQSVIAIESLGFILSSGFSIAASALVAQKLGAKMPDHAKACGWISACMAVAVLTVIGCIFWFFPRFLISFFSEDPAVLELGTQCLMLAAIAQPLMGITDALAGALRGAGDTRSPMVISLIGPLCIRLSMCWLFAFEMELGLIGIWIGTTIDWLSRTILLTVVFQRGRWQTIKV